MKKIALIFLMIAGMAFAAFKNSDKRSYSDAISGKKTEKTIGTQITFEVDTEKSSFGWHAKKVTGEHFGTARISKGEIYMNKGRLVSGIFEMDMTSIADTDITDPGSKSKLERHLKSEDFFDVEKFPKSTFKIKTWAPMKDAKPGEVNYYIKGDITIKGVTKEITFPATVNHNAKNITASAEFNIERTDFGLKFRSGKFDPGIGNKMINDEFTVKINLSANAK